MCRVEVPKDLADAYKDAVTLLVQIEGIKRVCLSHRVSNAASQLDDVDLCLKAAINDIQSALGAHAGKDILNQPAPEPQAIEKSEAIAQALAALPEEALKSMLNAARKKGLLDAPKAKQESTDESSGQPDTPAPAAAAS